MSPYASTVQAERSFPPPSAYYQRRTIDPTTPGGTPSMSLSPSQGLEYHGETVWPGYYAERTPTQPQAPSFNTYIVPAVAPSSSSLSYASSWQSATLPSALTPVEPVELNSGFDQPLSSKTITPAYQATDSALAVADHPTTSQHITSPHAATSPEPSYLPSYAFRSDRHRSPSSHASASEYTGWDSPKSSVEELEYPEHALSINEQDGYTGQPPQARSPNPSLPTSANASSSLQASVKVEPEDPDGCFILELSGSPTKTGGMGLSAPAALLAYSRSLLSQSLAPPTEVPLRATQANKEMRTMMGVFRLNPFSMHSLSVNLEDGAGVRDDVDWEDPQSPWSAGEAHPLEEEPVMFEFQLNLNNDEGPALESTPEKRRTEISGRIPEGHASLETLPSGSYGRSTAPSQALTATDEAQLRSFSPSFSLHPEDYDLERASYEDDARHALQSRDDQEHQDREDQDQDQDQQSESWGDVDYASRSEVDSSSTTTRSVHTPFHDSPEVVPTYVDTTYEHHHTNSPSFQPSAWDVVNEQYHEDHRFANPPVLNMPFKPAMAFGTAGMRVPRLHTTTSHPYLRKNLQNQQSHPTPHTLSHSHSVPQVQPQSFSLLTQPTHHSYHQSPPAQQPPRTLPTSQESENTFSTVQHHKQHYQESHLPIDSSSSLMPNHLMSGLHQDQGPPSPSYMRVIRGARNPNLEYEHDMNAYNQRSASRASHGGGKHSSSSEAYHVPPPMALHYIQSSGGATVAGNRRWSLPETVAVHSHGGQY